MSISKGVTDCKWRETIELAVGALPAQFGFEMEILSTLTPVAATLLSVAMRHRNCTAGWPLAAAGVLIALSMYAPELPFQACRPAIGLAKPVEIAPVYPPLMKAFPAVVMSVQV